MAFGFVAKNVLRVAAIVALASTMGGCSSVPSWMNPFGDDDKPAASDTTTASADDTPDASGTTPDLADVPDRPATATTSDSQQQVASSLAADRSQAQYSAETLRGDAQTAAAPPPPPSTVDTTLADAGTPSTDTPSTTSDSSVADTSSDSTTTTPTTTADAAPPPPAPAPSLAVTAPPPATQMAAAAPPPMSSVDRQPAVPPGSAVGVPGAQAPVMSDSQLGFQRSSAPPLDASVSQFVAPSIIDRYRQTAGNGSIALASTAVPTGATSRRSRQKGMGGPEEMSGSVVANLDSISSVPASAPATYVGASGSPSAVVFFPGDTTILSGSAKLQIRAAAERFRAGGGSGFIRVVGHSSSRTGNMPLERHLVVIFEKSQQRANSVAQELIKDGIPAEKVLVEAVGDSQPVYYESMPKGEDGNRRAEIFLQS